MWRKGVQKGCLVTLCNACGIRLKRGKCCPYCQVTYGDAEQQEVTSGSATKGEHTRPGAANAAVWLSCSACARWVHKACHAEHSVEPLGDKLHCPECQRRKLTRQAKPQASKRRAAPSAKAKAAKAVVPASTGRSTRPPKRVMPEHSSEDSIGSTVKAPKRARGARTPKASVKAAAAMAAAAALAAEDSAASVPTKRRTTVRARARGAIHKSDSRETITSDMSVGAATGAQGAARVFVAEAGLGLSSWAEAPPGGWGTASASPGASELGAAESDGDAYSLEDAGGVSGQNAGAMRADAAAGAAAQLAAASGPVPVVMPSLAPGAAVPMGSGAGIVRGTSDAWLAPAPSAPCLGGFDAQFDGDLLSEVDLLSDPIFDTSFVTDVFA